MRQHRECHTIRAVFRSSFYLIIWLSAFSKQWLSALEQHFLPRIPDRLIFWQNQDACPSFLMNTSLPSKRKALGRRTTWLRPLVNNFAVSMCRLPLAGKVRFLPIFKYKCLDNSIKFINIFRKQHRFSHAIDVIHRTRFKRLDNQAPRLNIYVSCTVTI